MKRMMWMLGLMVVLNGCVSADYFEQIQRSAHDVDAIKASDSEQEMKIRDLEKRVNELQSSLRPVIDQQGVTVDGASAGEVRVTLPQSVLFASGSVEINEQGRKVLADVAQVALKGGDKPIRVVGHSDALPLSGELKKHFTDNWELSAARAASVARVLIWGEGVTQDRIR
ncbi:MAG: hypothetical protein CO017_04515, partial [Zetaproteobacteria bacterium CG_4_8_14_3_um_filter_59_5]